VRLRTRLQKYWRYAPSRKTQGFADDPTFPNGIFYQNTRFQNLLDNLLIINEIVFILGIKKS
jgi:hypothetical protein